MRRIDLSIFIVLFRMIIMSVITLLLIFGISYILYSNGLVIPNEPMQYKVKGIDVSSFQGKVDWDVLSKKIDFAYIKATEGSNAIDPEFKRNYEKAEMTDLKIGYYMVFSFSSPGEIQAENFINNVGEHRGVLPPAIDIEFYGGYDTRPPAREDVVNELYSIITRFKEYYGVSPVIYATKKSYDMYISGGFYDCDIWIRDVVREPILSDDRKWKFWQYSDKGLLDGYQGEEKYIDLNVFCGSIDEFSDYPN